MVTHAALSAEAGRYDVVWVQWALLYLTDDDAVAFFRRAGQALKPGVRERGGMGAVREAGWLRWG